MRQAAEKGCPFPLERVSRVSGAHVNSSQTLTDFSPRFYNFIAFIPHALKNTRSFGQSIHKIRALAVERTMFCIEKILGSALSAFSHEASVRM